MPDSEPLALRDFRPRQQVVLPSSEVTRAAHPAVDAHTHLGRWLSDWVGRDGHWLVEDVAAFRDAMADFNVHAFVNLDGRWGDELEQNLDRFDRAHPGAFATFAHLDWGSLGDLGEQVARAAAVGAKGLKVWKDLGLGVRDGDGALLLPDDPRLSDVWDAAADSGLPIWWHTADPVAFFDPVDVHNENVELLTERPEWSFHDEAYPTFARLMEALEGVVGLHPRTTFVAVHGGCYAENLDWVSGMLDRYPNLNIDIAARLAQLGRQPRATRDLILRHPDRVLFGSDEIPHTGASYPTHFRFLETEDESFPHSDEDPPMLGRWMISGLGLPEAVLAAVYGGNARRLLPSLTIDGTSG